MAVQAGNENCIGRRRKIYHIVCLGGKYMIAYLNMLNISTCCNNLVDDQECKDKSIYEIVLFDNIEGVGYYEIWQWDLIRLNCVPFQEVNCIPTC